MSSPLRPRAQLALALMTAIGLAAPRPAKACCPAPHAGEEVQIAAQDVLLVWDAARRREHFIRRASFDTGQSDFGFIVPTPARPELAEVPDGVFASLTEASAPRIEERADYVLGSLFFLTLGASDSARSKAAAGVEVLHRQRVAGYDATVLAASDVDALSAWLSKHGYDARPELRAWVAPYVEAGWMLTAFKLSTDPDDAARVGYAVRMSFDTDTLLFPYRTPSDQHTAPGEAGSLLRVFVVAAERMAGVLGGADWDAAVRFASQPEALGAITRRATDAALPAASWLTVFEHHGWPRASEHDLTFRGAAALGERLPPPHIRRNTVPIPVELGLFPAALGLLLWRRRRRSRAG